MNALPPPLSASSSRRPRALASALALALALPLLGCARSAPKTPPPRTMALARSCAGSPSVSAASSSARATPVREADLLAEAASGPAFTDARDRVAHAAGLQTPLGSQEESPLFVLARMQLLKSEISAAHAYSDCLGDALEELEQHLVNRHARDETVLTALSIAIGAAGAIAAGAIELADQDSPAEPIVGIAAGATSAGLGASALFLPMPTIELDHEPNLLASVWTGVGDDRSFSPFVWKSLFLPRVDGPSPAAELRRRWKEMLEKEAGEGQRSSGPSALEHLIFGRGGTYSVDALRLRDAMLDHLETEVALMNQDLQDLLEAWTETALKDDPRADENLEISPGDPPLPTIPTDETSPPPKTPESTAETPESTAKTPASSST